MITSVITKSIGWKTMFRALISGEWTQDAGQSTRPFFNYKEGIGGYEHYISGRNTWKVPGTYEWNITLSPLYPGREYYYRFGVILADVKYYGEWLSFETNLPVFIQQSPTDITESSATLQGKWYQDDSGYSAAMFEWKKGEGGAVSYYSFTGHTRGAGYYTAAKPLAGLDPLETYYFRFGIFDLWRVKFWGLWQEFFTGEYNEMHFRAYGWDPKGNVIYGEDMFFTY